ncbi:MAG TPA: phosphocholine cytidylyltransferase family protein [Polyangiaceae bacterium]
MNIDTAVILVAGIGSRLRPITDDRPKALVDVGGETILARAVRLLASAGVAKLVLATGYREDAVRRAMQDAPVALEYVRNPDFESTQNSVSLALCRQAVGPGAFFKLDGDVVFQRQVLERLTRSESELGVAVDSGRKLDAEAMKVKTEGTRILAFGKGIPLAESAGESIGIERVSAVLNGRLFEALDRARARAEVGLYYEDVYSQMIADHSLSAEKVDVSDLAWTEVDDPSDLARARALVATGV